MAIVTITDAEAKPHGMTVNSLTSVSLTPPLILVCFDLRASLLDALLAAGEFAVNILEAHQEELSRRFAKPDEDRFDGVGYHAGQGRAPLLDGALAYLECAVEQAVPAGDHTIVIARVFAGTVQDGRPLCYYRGGYAALQ